MSWEVVCRLTNTLPTLRPHYSLPQAGATAVSIATLLARFPIEVTTCTRSWPTLLLAQTLPQFRSTAVTVGVYLIITPVPPRSRTMFSVLAPSLNTTRRGIAMR